MVYTKIYIFYLKVISSFAESCENDSEMSPNIHSLKCCLWSYKTPMNVHCPLGFQNVILANE